MADILKKLSEWQTWNGSDVANLAAIVTLIAFVLGTLWSVLLYPRSQLKRLEKETKDHLQTMLVEQTTTTLKPMVEQQIGVALATRYGDITGMQAAIEEIERQMGTANATIEGVREVRGLLAQLAVRLDQIEIVANEGARFARSINSESLITKRRVQARGAEWIVEAQRTHALPDAPQKPQVEKAVLDALLDICEPVIAYAVLYEPLTLAPAPQGTLVHTAYDALVEKYAAQVGGAGLSKAQKDHAFRERLTDSCIKALQNQMYAANLLQSGGPPDFYAHVGRICLMAVASDIVALNRGQQLQ